MRQRRDLPSYSRGGKLGCRSFLLYEFLLRSVAVVMGDGVHMAVLVLLFFCRRLRLYCGSFVKPNFLATICEFVV